MISFSAIVLLWGTFDRFGSAYEVSVLQTPHVINVAEGANDNITCHFDIPDNTLVKMRVTWKKDNGNNVHFETMELRHSNTSSSVLQFHSLLRNQSGLYTCEVEIDIPILWKGQGNGTYVIVTDGITVLQEPHNLQVSEGASVNMTCNFSIQTVRNYTMLANVTWIRIDDKRSKVHFERINSQLAASSSLQLPSMRLNDSGLYICEVDIVSPKLLKGKGNGTHIVVTAIKPGWPGNLAAAGVSLFGLLAIMVVIAIISKKRRGNSQVSVNRAENDQQAEVPEVTYASINNQRSHSSKNQQVEVAEVTYASINNQRTHSSKNQQRMEDKKQGQDSTNEEQVLYSAIRIKHPD